MADATLSPPSRVLLSPRQMASQSQVPQNSSDGSNTASSLLSTLIPVLLYAGLYFTLFLIFRNKFPRQYRPRTFVGSLTSHERTPNPKTGLFSWIGDFFSLPDSYVLNHHSLDGFLLLRLLKMAVVCCLFGCLVTWPILFPVNATGGGGKKQLDLLTMSNISNNFYRYFAHVGCAYLVFGFIIFMITRETIYYINLRQAYLLSPLYASRLSSRTVLFTSVPKEYLDESNLRRMLGHAVRRVWIATNTKELDDLVKRRDKAAYKLEGAETKLITTANKNRLKSEKKGGKQTNGSSDRNLESGSVAAKYITPKQRPTHKLGLLGLIGKKVDSIDWCRAELQKLIPQVAEQQAKHRAHEGDKLGSVFVEFTTLAEAQAAYQSLTHHQALHMAPRYTGMTPGEVIWSNLKIKWWERVIRGLVATGIVTALVIFWCVPVAAVGTISNINTITKIPAFSWLSFIDKIPSAVRGVVTGLLPVILLAVLMALLPIFLRLMAKFSGDPTRSAVELSVQNYYFAFQIVNVFLATTLGSAAPSVASQIATSGAGSIPTLLATNIPTASNFYLSYFILQGLAIVASLLLRITGLIIFMVLSKILDKTPRKMYKRWNTLASVGWGTLWPVYTNLFVIAICYACIAPLVMGFAAIGLYLFYLAHRYDLLFVSNQQIDTKGKLYPRALSQIFVGLYVAEACLIGLFAIGTGSSLGALGPLILMILFLIFTILYQAALKAALKPLIDYLPKSLESEERRLLEEEKLGEGGPQSSGIGPAPHKKPNLLTKFLKPHIYNDYATMRRLVPREIAVRYEPEQEELAYYNPSITEPEPLLWIPRDQMGISRQEIADTEKIIPITDEDSQLDNKGKIVWDSENGRPPIYQPKVYY